MLEIQNLSAGYPGHPVLQNVSLSIPAGKVTVIAGPNGCGKSTLLKALAGILPHSGTVSLDSRELSCLPSRELAQTMAFLPQNRPVPEITAERLVLHGRFPYLRYPRRYREEDRQIAREAMARMGISHLAQRNLPTLSGGQRQKVYIAMALAQNTPVILLDEPTAFLDISHQLQLMHHIRQLAAEGKTVVAVLHDLTMALEQADHLILMENGTITTHGTPEAVFQTGLLSQTFQIPIRRTQTPDGWKYYYLSPEEG